MNKVFKIFFLLTRRISSLKDDILNDDIRLYLLRENSFDAVRYFFALSILIAHFLELIGAEPLSFISSSVCVKGFFILSGFLVFNSFIEKTSVWKYVDRRVKRVCPAYFFTVVLCAIVGVFLTQLPVREYFLSIDTFKYLIANLSFLNFLQPTLPGVFENNPLQAVNGALWTIKIEVLFYISVPFVYFLLRKYNKLLIILGILLLSMSYWLTFLYLYNETGDNLYLTLRKQFPGQFMYFYSGTLILLYFDYFQRYVKYIFPAAAILFFFRNEHIVLTILEPLSLASLIIGFAYNFKYLNFLRRYDNISYGIYLLHFPIIQVIVSCGIVEASPVFAFMLSLLITIILALFSWKFLEKPALKTKKRWIKELN